MRRHIPLQLRVHAHVGCMIFASTRLITLQNLKIVFHETALFLLMIVSDLNSSNWCTRVHISFIWTLCVATRCALVKGRGNSIWGRAHRHFCWEGKWLGSSLSFGRRGYAGRAMPRTSLPVGYTRPWRCLWIFIIAVNHVHRRYNVCELLCAHLFTSCVQAL